MPYAEYEDSSSRAIRGRLDSSGINLAISIPEKEGWLWVRRRLLESWKRAYCKLEADTLHAYADERSASSKLVQPIFEYDLLTNTTQLRRRGGGCCSSYAFTLLDPHSEGLASTLICVSNDRESTLEWVDALSELVGECDYYDVDNTMTADGYTRQVDGQPPMTAMVSPMMTGRYGRGTQKALFGPLKNGTDGLVSPEISYHRMCGAKPPDSAERARAADGQTIDGEVAMDRLRKAVRKFINARMASAHPATFRTLAPEFGTQVRLADHGKIQFAGRVAHQTARYMHLAERRAPFQDMSAYVRQTLALMTEHWGVKDASILISVTGSAQDFSLDPRLDIAFKRGLAEAAQATDAWITTGGTETGVMALVGHGLAEHNALSNVQLIGIANWGTIKGREMLENNFDNKVEYAKAHVNDHNGANLEPNHTLFLLVDTGLEGSQAWGGEIQFRARLEAEYTRRKKIPRVVVVVQGGPGTLNTVLACIEDLCPIVLIADSGGVAELLDVFLKTYKDTKSNYFGRGQITPKFKQAYDKHRKKLEKIAELDKKHQKIHSFALGVDTTQRFDDHLLAAVLNDPDSCPPQGRLKLAVEWKRFDVVQQVMQEQGTLTQMSDSGPAEKSVGDPGVRLALQVAITQRSAEIAKLLLSQNFNLISRLDFIEFYRSATACRLFNSNPRLQEDLVAAASSNAKATSARRYSKALSAFLSPLVPTLNERLLTMQRNSREKLARQQADKLSASGAYRPKRNSSKGRSSISAPRATKSAGAGLSHSVGALEEVAAKSTGGRPAQLSAITSVAQAAALAGMLGGSSGPEPVCAPTVDDLLIWAVLVRDQPMAEALWQSMVSAGDPIRLALLAGAAAANAAKNDALNEAKYNENAEKYVQWAFLVLDRCRDKNEAQFVLRRPSQHGWPHSILRLAVTTNSKTFIKHQHVQTLVDDSWQGRTMGSDFAVPHNSSYTSIVLHLFFPTLHIINNRTGTPDATLPRPRLEKFMSNPCSLFSDLCKHYSHPAFRGFLAIPVVKFTIRVVVHLVYLCVFGVKICQNHVLPHSGITNLDIVFYTWTFGLWLDEANQWKDDAMRGEAHLDDVWNIYDVVLWSMLLAAGAMRASSAVECPDVFGHTGETGGSHPTMSLQVAAAAADGVASSVGQLASAVASGVGEAARRMGETLGEAVSEASHPQRGLRGHESHDEEPPTYAGVQLDSSYDVFDLLYEHCWLVYAERLVLCFCFIFATMRMLQWLYIPLQMGLIAIILGEILDDLKVFLVFAGMFILSFGAALVGLMPLLGSAPFNADGAAMMPFWAMFGEFGEIESMGKNGGITGSMVLWMFTFVMQIVFVNLLIAMMTNTFDRVRKNAAAEWRFRRVTIVDEFNAQSSVPAPISLPVLAWELTAHVWKWLRGRNIAEAMGVNLQCKGRFLDSLPQSDVNLKPNATPDLLWMQEHLEREEQLALKTNAFKLDTLLADRDRTFGKLLENQEILQMVRTTLLKIDHDLAHGSLDSAASRGRMTSICADPLSSSSGDTRRGSAVPNPGAEVGRGSMATPPPTPVAPTAEESSHRQALEDELERTMVDKARLRAEVEETKKQLDVKDKEHHDKLSLLNRKLGQSRMHTSALHVKARGPHPMYPARASVPDNIVHWTSPHPAEGYHPTAYTAQPVVDNDVLKKPGGWADPQDVRLIAPEEWNADRRASYEALYTFDVQGRPLNPKGRTGMCERGLLGKWGPNHAADPIVTRYDPERPYQIQMVAIQRRDTSVWAIPGGMVDYGETVSATVRREFTEEAGNLPDEAQRETFERAIDELFAHGTIVYRGYVDDPRNTDNAWMETMAYHFHCTAELGHLLPLAAGDDAGDVMWLDIDSANYKWQTLYASHKEIVQKAVNRLERSSSTFDE